MKDSTIANNAANAASSTASGLGAGASNISSALIPQLTRQLTNPAGYSQQDIGSMLSSGLAGSGGATAGLTGAAGKMGMTERNPNGFSAALDSAARTAGKTNAGISEGISANNAGVQQQQQSQAGSLLSSLYGTDVSGQNAAAGQVAKDAQIGNSMNGLNTTMGVLGQLSGDAANAGKAYASF
jgi:hypothetical protein